MTYWIFAIGLVSFLTIMAVLTWREKKKADAMKADEKRLEKGADAPGWMRSGISESSGRRGCDALRRP